MQGEAATNRWPGSRMNLPRKEWKDDVDLWPEVTYVEVGIYLSVKT